MPTEVSNFPRLPLSSLDCLVIYSITVLRFICGDCRVLTGSGSGKHASDDLQEHASQSTSIQFEIRPDGTHHTLEIESNGFDDDDSDISRSEGDIPNDPSPNKRTAVVIDARADHAAFFPNTVSRIAKPLQKERNIPRQQGAYMVRQTLVKEPSPQMLSHDGITSAAPRGQMSAHLPTIGTVTLLREHLASEASHNLSPGVEASLILAASPSATPTDEGSYVAIFVMILLACVTIVCVVVHTRQPTAVNAAITLEEKIFFLKQVELFKRLPCESLTILANAVTLQDFWPGQRIIKQGEEGNMFFMIKSGSASVAIDGHTVATLTSGDYFGERSLICAEPRIATITCRIETTVFTITRNGFINLGLTDQMGFPKRMAVAQGADHDVEIEPPTPKTPEEEELIINAVIANKSLEFMHLTEKSIKEMATFAWKVDVASGTEIIRQDDETADYFYVVQQGSFLVTTKAGASQLTQHRSGASKARHGVTTPSQRANSKASRLNHHSNTIRICGDWKLDQAQDSHSIAKGGSFGALALLYNAPRAATVTAKEPSSVWVIARPHFKDVLLRAAEEHIDEYVQYLNSVEMTRRLPEQQKVKIAKALGEMTFKKGDLPCKQGDEGDVFYILIAGTVDMIRDGVSLYPEGDYPTASAGKGFPFGEWSPESEGICRGTTVMVMSEKARCLFLDRTSYSMLLDKHSPRRSTRRVGKIQFKDLKRVGLVGSGSFGAVELVEHAQTGETYALKVQSKGFIVEQHIERLILNEKNLQLMCDSPFIIQLVETFNGKESLYMLLELALGGEVFSVYNAKVLWGKVPHAKYYAAGIVFAFEHLHGMKIIHRDLKPENMLLSHKGHVKLTDFGLAKLVVGRTFTICGTEEYFSPETLASKGTTRAADWWALGIVIFELLSGYAPFNASSPMGTFKSIGEGIERVYFPQACRGDVKCLIQDLCQKEPYERLPMKQGATSNIKCHAWYRDFDWDAMFNQTMDPPYVPQVQSKNDMSNFDAWSAWWNTMPQQAPYSDPGTGWDEGYATSA